MIDVLVVGGGPVGLVSAIQAATAGLLVTIAEPRTGVIDKACGEGLMPETLACLHGLGVVPDGIEFAGIRYLQGKRKAEARFKAGPGLGVRRTELERALIARATELGVVRHETRITEIEQSAQWVKAAGVQARYLIGADGLHSTVRRSASLDKPTTGRQRYGLRQHFQVAPWSDVVEVYWLPDVEVYVTPVGAETVGVAVLGYGPLSLERAISQLPDLARRLAGAEPASELRGAGPLRQQAISRTSGRILLVGDAAGYVDALTGEGLRVGFQEAAAAVACIRRGAVGDYEQQWRKITRSYRALTGTLLWCSARPKIRRTIVPSAQALPKVFAAIVNSLAD